ncbi:DNA-directed RNA polymerases I, II, and III subunit RPABC3 [Nematocida sp. AWRm80]|nr:DNA-directed RNA polymerases I, II, and III subunit RPABC3 [Nematocida sp. AWRm80]
MKLFSEVLTLEEINPDGKMFEDTSRGIFQGDNVSMILDYPNKIFTPKKMDRIEIALFSDSNGFSEKDIPEKYTFLLGNGKVDKTKECGNSQLIEMYFSGLFLSLNSTLCRLKESQHCLNFFLGAALLTE